MRAGRILEPAVAEFFAEDTGRDVWAPSANGFTIYKNEDYPFLAATPDRFQRTIDSQGTGNLQLKTASGYTKEHWEGGVIPTHYEVQVQIEMLCTGLSWGSISVLFDGRTHEYRDYVLLPNDQQEVVLKALEKFWGQVQSGTPPDPDHRDLDAVKALFPSSDPESILELTAEQAYRMEALWAQKETHRLAIKDAEAGKADAEANLKYMIGKNEEAHAPDGTIYRLPTTRVKKEEKVTPASEYSFRKLSRRRPKA